MGKSKLVIRVDGDSIIGMGHIYRGLALASILEDKYLIEFLVTSKSVVPSIISNKYFVTHIPERKELLDEPEWINSKYSVSDFIVIDGYQFTQKYQKELKEFGFKLIYIDDLIQRNQVADVVINHSPGVTRTDYSPSLTTKYALGLNYAILRNSFINFDRSNCRKITSIENVLVSFGGSSPSGFVVQTVEQLLKLPYIKNAHVLLGVNTEVNGENPFNDVRVKLHHGLAENEVFELMTTIDLGIVPSSTICLELASLGVPMVLGHFADNQKGIYKGLASVNGVLGIGDYNTFDFTSLQSKIESVNTPERLGTNDLVGLFKGSPKDNIVNLFRLEAIALKEASFDDLQFVFELANEPLVRSNSFDSTEITLSQHTNWYNNQLKNKDVVFFIVFFEGEKIGQVRFVLDGKHSVIGISISEKFRGKGLAVEVLKKSVRKYFKKSNLPVLAYIKSANLRSVSSFKKSGFSFYKNVMMNEDKSYIYKIEKP